MSLFNKLFGGKKKEQAPPPPPPVPSKMNKQVQGQKTVFQINQKINKLEDQTNKLEHEAEIVTAKAKELMAANKKKEAKVQVEQLAEIKKKIEALNVRKKLLRTQKTSVEAAMTDLDTAETMEKAIGFLKGNEDLNQKINEIIMDTKDIQMNMQETERLMRELAENNQQDDEQTDQLFRQLQAEANAERAAVIQQNLNKPQTQIQTATIKPVASKVSVEDDLEQWLN